MEFTVNKIGLLRELALIQGGIEKKTTIPVLANVLIEARGDALALTSTDLELSIRSQCPATVKEPGSSTLLFRKLLDYVRLLPDAELVVKIGETHAATVTCGRSKTRIAGTSRENFPELAVAPATPVQVPALLLAELIGKTVFAISNEGSRYTLNGALLLLNPDAITMVATDGHRMAFIEAKQSFDGLSGGQIRMLVPKKALLEIQKLAAESLPDATVGLSSDETNLFFQFGNRLLITRKLSGQFPDYERVLRHECDKAVVVKREEMAAAIRRVSQFADERSRAIHLTTAPGEVKLYGLADFGESEESVPTDDAPADIKIGFNAEYLLDFLGAITSETVLLELKDESAAQLRPSSEVHDYRYVVMPMRI